MRGVIALCCTGSICASPEEPSRVVEYLQQQGYTARFQQETYLALPAERRAAIFLEYLRDETIDIIWSLRGGEGSADILPFLAVQAPAIRHLRPKILVGFSDFTPILVYFYQNFNWACIHGPVARQLISPALGQASKDRVLSCLRALHHPVDYAVKQTLALPSLKPLNYRAIHTSPVIGRIVGGNLSLLQISIKDVWELQPSQRILLIEEVNEPPYKVARSLKYLYRIGWFQEAKAVIFAGFDMPGLNEAVFEVLREFAQHCGPPVFFTTSIGHGTENYAVHFSETTLFLH